MAGEPTGGVLSGYDPGGYYCEMTGGDGGTAAHTAPIRSRLADLLIEDLRRRAGDAERELFNPSFPRSVSSCVHELERLVQELRRRHRLHPGDAVSATLGALCGELDARSIDDVIQMGIHRFNDGIQMRLNSVSNEMHYAFFGGPRPASVAAARSQARTGA